MSVKGPGRCCAPPGTRTPNPRIKSRSTTCAYGYSSYRGSDEGGGSMHLACDEGSVLGATMTAGGTEPPSDDGTRSWTITIDLAQGYLLEP